MKREMEVDDAISEKRTDGTQDILVSPRLESASTMGLYSYTTFHAVPSAT